MITPIFEALPPCSCDTHTHIFLDPETYPFYEGRIYTPPPAPSEALLATHEKLGISRVVVVQPSVYGLDNSATLNAVRWLGSSKARAVVVVDEGVSDEELRRLGDAGARGIRVNIEIDGVAGPRAAGTLLRRMALRVAPLGWHVQILASLDLIAACSDVIADLPVPIVLDHYAGVRSARDQDKPSMRELMSLVGMGKAYIKLSAPYRMSREAGFYDMEDLTRSFVECNPQRMLWGSDWPHPQPSTSKIPTEVGHTHEVDLAGVLASMREWIRDEEAFRKMLVDNPAKLYGFE